MGITSHGEALVALAEIYQPLITALGGEKAPAVRDIMSRASPVDRYVGVFELAHENREALPTDVKQSAADIGMFATSWGFHGLDVDNRGKTMADELVAENGH